MFVHGRMMGASSHLSFLQIADSLPDTLYFAKIQQIEHRSNRFMQRYIKSNENYEFCSKLSHDARRHDVTNDFLALIAAMTPIAVRLAGLLATPLLSDDSGLTVAKKVVASYEAATTYGD